MKVSSAAVPIRSIAKAVAVDRKTQIKSHYAGTVGGGGLTENKC